MIRFLTAFSIFLPLVGFAIFHLYAPAEYTRVGHLAAANEAIPAKAKPAALKPTQAKTDPLKLKREDLIEGEDNGWYPELPVAPEDYLEEMELPERADVPDETKNT